MCMIPDGGILRVDLLMVEEPACSSVFPVSLHHCVGKTNGAWMAVLHFDNAWTMRMLSRILTDHKSDLNHSIMSELDHKRSDILRWHSKMPLQHL